MSTAANTFSLLTFIITIFIIFIYQTNQYACSSFNAGCETCLSINHCFNCLGGYGFNLTDAAQTTCAVCQLSSCLNCSSNAYRCDQCVSPYGLSYSAISNSYACSPCTANNCSDCSTNASICLQCDPSAARLGLSSGACLNCTDSNCVNCTLNSTLCIQCMDSYGVDIASGVCIPCTTVVPNCNLCPFNSSNCVQCLSTFGTSSGACIPCQDDQCIDCAPDPSICRACGPNYGLNASGSCIFCIVANCSQCSLDYLICSSCTTLNGIRNNTCVPCADTSCLQCASDYAMCTECIPGKGTSGGGACIDCTAPCNECLFADINLCLNCLVSYYLNAQACVPCLDGCIDCQNGTICQFCDAGRYMNTSSMCPVCPNQCVSCFLNSSYLLPECDNCTAGNQLNHNLPPVCRQICGDGITSEHMCDNELGIPYDGCNDDCQIQQNFECMFISNETICSYNSTLDMQLLQLKKQLNSNQFTIKFTIFPPLYVFSTLSESEISEIFKLVNPNIIVRKVTYDPLGILQFQGQIVATISAGDTIILQYDPSILNKPQFYASVNSVQPITLAKSLYFLSSYGVILGQILAYICYGISALGWISWLIGIFLRKLAGLQSLFTIQICWLTFVWIGCDLLLPFQQIDALRFSVGYNYAFISQNATQTISSPYLTQYKLSPNYFANNFNLPIILMIIVISGVLVTSIRLSNFLKNTKKGIKLDSNKKVEIEQEAQKLMNQNGYAYTLLMQVCMAFLVYFVTSSSIFFQISIPTHIISLILFIFTLCVYGFTFVQFYRDPCSFDYFRFSFRITQLAMSQYLIVIIVLLLSVSLLTTLPIYSWISLAPILILLLYTLIYRPYKYLKQNLRFSFYCLVICSFIGFKAYAEFISKSELSSNITMTFMLINVGILLPIVVILSLVSNIYYYYYENYLLPKQEQEKAEQKAGMLKSWRKKILNQLVIVKKSKNMEQIQQDTTFRQFIRADNSMKNASNALRDEFMKQQFMRLQNGSNPLRQNTIQQSINKTFGKYKEELKLQMINNKFGKKDDVLIHKIDGKGIKKQKQEPRNGKEVKNVNKIQRIKREMNIEKQSKMNEKEKFVGSVDFMATKQDVAKLVIMEENTFVNLQGAIEIIQDEMKGPVDKTALQEFKNILT